MLRIGLAEQVHLHGGIDGGQAVEAAQHLEAVGHRHALHPHPRIVGQAVAEGGGSEDGPDGDGPRHVGDGTCIQQRDQRITGHAGMDAQAAPVGQGIEHRRPQLADAGLQHRPVGDQPRRHPGHRLGHRVHRAGIVGRRGVVDLHPGHEPGQGHGRRALDHRQGGVDQADHRDRPLQHRRGEVRRQAEIAHPAPVRGGDLDDGRVQGRGGHPVPGLAVTQGTDLHPVRPAAVGPFRRGKGGLRPVPQTRPVRPVHSGNPHAGEGDPATQRRIGGQGLGEGQGLGGGTGDVEANRAVGEATAKVDEGVLRRGQARGAGGGHGPQTGRPRSDRQTARRLFSKGLTAPETVTRY